MKRRKFLQLFASASAVGIGMAKLDVDTGKVAVFDVRDILLPPDDATMAIKPTPDVYPFIIKGSDSYGPFGQRGFVKNIANHSSLVREMLKLKAIKGDV